MQNFSATKKFDELEELLQKETLLRKAAEEEVSNLKSQVSQWKRAEVIFLTLIHYFLYLLSHQNAFSVFFYSASSVKVIVLVC